MDQKKSLSSFFYLNATQFFGALNDNLYKLLLVFFLIDLYGKEKSPTILALTGIVFVLPFLLFSIPSGVLADRYSKSRIIVITKLFELAAVLVGVTGFLLENSIISYTALFLLATESALFSPSKYGIIPEIVPQEKISKANGYLSSFTFLAVIIGTFLAAFLTQLTGRNLPLAVLATLLFALIGFWTSKKIPNTPPAGSKQLINPFFIKDILVTLKRANKTKHLLLAILGSGYFLFVGSFTQLNIIPFTMHCLHLSDVDGGYLFLITALGIGIGSLIAGKVSGTQVELGLSPLGAIGMTCCFLILEICSDSLIPVMVIILFIGIFGGLYLVPLDSFIQVMSPPDERGQNVAANNFMAFIGVLISAAFLYLFNDLLGLSPARGFTFMAILTLSVSIFFVYFLHKEISQLILHRFFQKPPNQE